MGPISFLFSIRAYGRFSRGLSSFTPSDGAPSGPGSMRDFQSRFLGVRNAGQKAGGKPEGLTPPPHSSREFAAGAPVVF